MECGGGVRLGRQGQDAEASVYPALRPSGLSPGEAAWGTSSRQKLWGWPWLKPTSDTVPLPWKYRVIAAWLRKNPPRADAFAALLSSFVLTPAIGSLISNEPVLHGIG